MKKILAFDSWTGGRHHLIRLTQDLPEFNFSLKLLHLGSWGDDLGRDKQERIDSLDIVDISFYGKLGLDEILELESPDIVLFLSTHTFAHRALIRYSKKKGIPTFLLGHGLVGVMANKKESVDFSRFFNRLVFIFPRIGRFFIYVLPAYINALRKTGGEAQDWFHLLKDIGASFISSGYLGVSPMDSRTTAYAVYTQGEISEYTFRYKCKREDIFVVGNPDLLHFGFADNNFGLCSDFELSDTNELMYIQTGYELEGLFFKDDDDFFGHIMKTKAALIQQSLSLTVKLKQGDSRPKLTEKLLANDIDVIRNEDYLSRLKSSVAVIIEPTTAALIPALLGLPLLLARYGPLSDAPFGKVFLSYPMAQNLTNPSDVINCLIKLRNIRNHDEIKHWIDENSGPPANHMPRRVLQAIHTLLTRTIKVG